jgi:hypothetical protein
MPARTALFSLACLLGLVCACGPGELKDPISVDPGGENGYLYPPGSGPELNLGVKLKVESSPKGSSPVLAVARDDTTSDSLNLYLDVTIENLGPDVVLLPAEANHLTFQVRVSFVDVPYKKSFDHGRLKLSVGQTDTGLEIAEEFTIGFLEDTTLTLSLPVSRIDSFRVADNVAVYGQVLSPNRFIIAREIRRFDTPGPPKPSPAPDLVGFVKSVDPKNSRLYVSNATVVLTDSTRVLDSSGNYLPLESLETGNNGVTVTALAWGYTQRGAMIANGWEFKPFSVYVARAITP